MKPANSQLRIASVLALVLHLIAGVGMALILAKGLGTNTDVEARLNFLVQHRTAWTFAWLTWTAAAVSILYFYLVLSSLASGPVVRLAVLLTASAIGPDLAGQVAQIGVLPDMAARALVHISDRDLFFLLDRIAVLMSGYLANGLYSLSAILLSWCTRTAFPARVWAAGLIVGVSGLMLSVAALQDSVRGMFCSNVVLVPFLLIWLAMVAYYAGSGFDSLAIARASAKR